jgi:hypothetical protein
VGTTAQNAYKAAISSLKGQGLWTKLDDMWVPGGDFAATRAKLKGTGPVVYVGIVSGDYTENLGVKGDGTTAKYVRRQYNPKHLGAMYQYLRTAQSSGTIFKTGLGCADASNHFSIGYNTSATGTGASTSIRGKAGGAFSTPSPAAFNGNAAGGYGSSRRSNSDAELTYNATSLNISGGTTTGADATVEAYELLLNANGSVVAANPTPLDANSYTGGSAFFNTGLTQAEMFAFHGIMQTLQTALGRNV